MQVGAIIGFFRAVDQRTALQRDLSGLLSNLDDRTQRTGIGKVSVAYRPHLPATGEVNNPVIPRPSCLLSVQRHVRICALIRQSQGQGVRYRYGRGDLNVDLFLPRIITADPQQASHRPPGW